MSCNDILSLLDLQNTKKHIDDFGRLVEGTESGYSTNGVTGQIRPTYNKVINDMNSEFDGMIVDMNSEFDQQIQNLGYTRVGTFAAGATLLNGRQTLLWDIADGGDGQEYGWSGSFPPSGKVVPPGSTPLTTGGIAVGAWMSRFDPALPVRTRESLSRSYAESGFNLVDGSFEAGGALVNATDVLLQERTGKAFSGPAGAVAAGTNPASGGYTLIEKLLRDDFQHYVSATPAYVDDYKKPGMTDTQAIDAAMASSKYVVFSARKYTYTKPLISVGHTLEGAVGETFYQDGTVIEFDIADTPSIPFAFRNITQSGYARNIRFIQKSWLCVLNGGRIDRISHLDNCDFSYFNGHGFVLESDDTTGRGCYASTLINVTGDYNAKHGLVFGGGANAVIVINPVFRWNGSPSYGVAPSVAGVYDGINASGPEGPFPGNTGQTGEPQGCVIIGGNVSYNSRWGYNFQRWWDGSVVGGYAELNKVGDSTFVNVFGSSVLNLMSASHPTLSVPDVDPLASSRSLLIYPNNIKIRGRDYGCGQKSTVNTAAYLKIFEGLRCFGSGGLLDVVKTTAGGVKISKTGGATVNWDFDTTPTLAKSISLGDGSLSPIAGQVVISRSGNVEGNKLLSLAGSAQWTEFFVANTSGYNAAAAALRIAKNSSTYRSINAAGTVNASGADYAEYMHKDEACGEIAKGDICGVTAEGLLTDRFDRAISFVVKSTDPAYVGGDTWGAIEEPIRYPEHEAWLARCETLHSSRPVLGEDETEQEYATRFAEWSDLYEEVAGSEPEKLPSDEWLAWVEDLEARRQRVDRIAFCGQVPCNVVSANPGDYIVPVRNDDGSIGGIAIKEPSFEQYRRAVGAVWKVMDDGRAWIAVKVS